MQVSKKKKKKSSKSRCFIVKKFQIINIGEAVKVYQHFQNVFKTWRFLRTNFDKRCLKVGKIKMPDFKKMYV